MLQAICQNVKMNLENLDWQVQRGKSPTLTRLQRFLKGLEQLSDSLKNQTNCLMRKKMKSGILS